MTKTTIQDLFTAEEIQNSEEQAFGTLKENIPYECRNDDWYTDYWKRKDLRVIVKRDGCVDRWPGKQKNVYCWWELEDGSAIGWNESPSKGWTFPMVRTRKVAKN